MDLPARVGISRAMTFQTSFLEDAPVAPQQLERAEEGARFEQLDLAFHERVREGFLAQAAAEPERWVALDALQPVNYVSELVWEQVKQRLFPEAGADQEARSRPGRKSPPQGVLWPLDD